MWQAQPDMPMRAGRARASSWPFAICALGGRAPEASVPPAPLDMASQAEVGQAGSGLFFDSAT